MSHSATVSMSLTMNDGITWDIGKAGPGELFINSTDQTDLFASDSRLGVFLIVVDGQERRKAIRVKWLDAKRRVIGIES